jgi:hypothetical protein
MIRSSLLPFVFISFPASFKSSCNFADLVLDNSSFASLDNEPSTSNVNLLLNCPQLITSSLKKAMSDYDLVSILTSLTAFQIKESY